mgnify:CR=1 FL=1
MDKPFINEQEKLFFREGKITYIRPLLKSDIRTEYLAWLNDPNLNKYSSHFRTWPTLEQDIEDFYYKGLKDNNNIVFATCCKETGKHFGNHSLNNIDWINRHAAHNVNIGIKKYRSIHYIDSLNTVLDFAFNTLNLHKITGGAEIPGTMEFMTRLGYKKEGVLKKHVFRDGEYHDIVVFAIFKDDYLLKQKSNNK